jgi:hypothetical protein
MHSDPFLSPKAQDSRCLNDSNNTPAIIMLRDAIQNFAKLGWVSDFSGYETIPFQSSLKYSCSIIARKCCENFVVDI